MTYFRNGTLPAMLSCLPVSRVTLYDVILSLGPDTTLFVAQYNILLYSGIVCCTLEYQHFGTAFTN